MTITTLIEHQPRERSVPCQVCRRATWNTSAICHGCDDLCQNPDHTNHRFVVNAECVSWFEG